MVNDMSFDLMSDPRYKECWKTYQGLNSQMNELDKHVQDLLSEGNEKATDLQEQKVQALLAGADPDNVIQKNWQKDYQRALERRRLLMAAIEKVKRELEEVRSLVSKEICSKIAPKNLEIGKEFYLALIQLGQAITKKNEFYDSLYQADIAYTSYLPILSNIRLGDPMDFSSFFCILLREGVRQEFLTENDIPLEWRTSWFKRSGYKLPKPATVDGILTRVKQGKPGEAETGWTLET